MRLIAIAFLLCVAAPCAVAQSLWNPKLHARPITADSTARGVGDLLTIVIEENTSVANDEQTQLSKESSLSALISNFDLLPNLFNTLPKVEAEEKREFDGNAKYDKDQRLDTRMSVMVQDVMPNGVLMIEGTRRVIIDGETKIVRIQGLVRPQDVTRENTVSSTMVANASISYEGDGFMSKTTMKGWFSRLLDYVWPF